MQDGIRVTRSLTVNAGVRYDLQTFEVPGLVSNPLYAPSGKVPTDTNNFSPRVGFTYALREHHPIVLRGGFGRFYSLVPNMYASQVETDNGLTQTHLFLDIMNPAQAAVFPKYPNALVNCPSGATTCTPPASVAKYLTTQVSAFSPNFQTPYTEQASFTLEYGIGANLTASASYLYVHGEHLIRSLDANLPKPKITEYPVYDDQSVFTGDYYSVASFATWQTTRSVDCPYPPCINDVQRPDPRLGTINSFESAASSVYNGLTLLLKGKIGKQLFVRVGYTFAKAIDDGTDALVVGRPGNVQNAYATQLERGLSVTDQRNRFVASTVYEPASFHYEQPALNALFNHWKVSTVFTAGSGRPHQRDHGGRRQSRRQHLQRSPSRSGEKRLHRPRLFHRRCSPQQGISIERAGAAYAARGIVQCHQSGQPAGRYFRRRISEFGRSIRRLLHAGRQGALSGRIREEFQVPDAHQFVCAAASAILDKGKLLSLIADSRKHLCAGAIQLTWGPKWQDS